MIGVLSHEFPLDGVKGPGLVEDLVGDGELADIMQLGGTKGFVELFGVEVQLSGDGGGERGHARDVVDASPGCVR